MTVTEKTKPITLETGTRSVTRATVVVQAPLHKPKAHYNTHTNTHTRAQNRALLTDEGVQLVFSV